MGGYLPSDVIQESIDAVGIDYTLGDIEDGSRVAAVSLRRYQQCLMQLHRAVHWNFCRRESPLTLLADSTGQTPNVGTIVPSGEFQYEYSWPLDAMKLRYIPWHRFSNPGVPNNNIVPPNNNSPLMTGIGNQPNRHRIQPARFVITNDPNYPPPPGQITWEVQGVSPQGRVVILTNVQNAKAVYTYLALYPSVWDSLFRAALVAYIASEIALPLSVDKKMGMALRTQQMAIAKEKILEARIANGNEDFNNADLRVDWIDTRFQNGGAGWGYGGWGFDGFFGGMDGCCGVGAVSASAAF